MAYQPIGRIGRSDRIDDLQDDRAENRSGRNCNGFNRHNGGDVRGDEKLNIASSQEREKEEQKEWREASPTIVIPLRICHSFYASPLGRQILARFVPPNERGRHCSETNEREL